MSGRDLTGIGFQECELRGVSLSHTQLRGASVADCVAGELHATVFFATRSGWPDVSVDHSRLESVVLYEVTLRSVHIDGSKLDFVKSAAPRSPMCRFPTASSRSSTWLAPPCSASSCATAASKPAMVCAVPPSTTLN